MFLARASLLTALLLPSSARAGGMFYGIKCGAGATTQDAVKVLNERIDKLDGYAGTYHRGLALLQLPDQVLACVLVNRKDHNKPAEEDKSQVQCLSGSADRFLEHTDGLYFSGRQRGELSALSMVLERDGTVTACALSEVGPRQSTP